MKRTNMKYMLNLKMLLICLLTSLFFNQSVLLAQTPGTGIFFQAIARDQYTNPAKDRKIYVQASIIQSTATGTKVLIETHQTTTDGSGVFSISVGQGTRTGGTVANLDKVEWAKGPYYLNLKISITPMAPIANWDYTKDWIDLGTSPFGTVPYALYSGSSGALDDKLSIADTAKMLAIYAKAQVVNNLSTQVNSKLSATDTATMLAPYAKMVSALVSSNITSLTATAVNAALDSKVNVADSGKTYVTPLQLKGVTFDTTSLISKINKKINLSDSTTVFVTPLQLAAKTFDSTTIYTQLGTKLNKADTASLSSRINLKSNTTDVTTGLALKLNIADTSVLFRKADTASLSSRINLKSNITDVTTGLALKLNIADTSVLLRKADTVTLSNRINLKSNTTDVTSGLALKFNKADTSLLLQKADTATLSNRINLKANSTDVNSGLALKLDASQKGAASGVASLDINSKVPASQIPVVSFQSANVVASQAAMLGLSQAVVGSIAIRTDSSKNFVLSGADPSIRANWVELAVPTSVTTINGIPGAYVTLTTNEIGEGTNNKYYTDTRARNAISASGPLNYNAATGTLTMTAATTSSNGYLSSSDFTIFNNKQNALVAGTDYATPSGNITGNAANVTGVVSIVNGGTGTTTATGALITLGAEAISNKSTATDLGNTNPSDTLYPSQKAVKRYVDLQSANAGVADLSITNAKLAGSITASKLIGTDIATVGTITSGVWSATTIALNKGGTGATTAADARTNLGLVIGTNVMAANAITTLTGDIAGSGNGSFATTVNSVGGVSSATIATLPTSVNTNTASITAETTRATNAESALDTRITSNTASITANTTSISNETTRATNAESALDTRITSNTNSITANTTSISNETTRATNAESALDTRITSNTSSITANTTSISNETTRATNAESALDTRITSNTTSITAETTRATNAESALDTRITSNTSSITAETTRATNAESALDTRITSNTSSITAEITRATNAESALDTRITSNTSSITANTSSITTNTADILLRAPLASPAFTGVPTAPTPATSDNSTKVATTEYVKASITAANAGISSIGDVSSTSNAKGAVISGTTQLILTPADANFGGVVTTATQTFAGAKTFTNTVTFGKDIKVNGMTIGRPANPFSSNTQNIAIGNNVMGKYAPTAWTTDYNIGIGYSALFNLTNGGENVAIGSTAMYLLSSGDYNTGVGSSVMTLLTTGNNNTVLGTYAGSNISSGSDNTFIGSFTGSGITGSNNILIGSNKASNTNTGTGITTGSNNTIIGSGIRSLPTTLSNNIILADGGGTIRAQHNGTTGWTLGTIVSGTWSGTTIGSNVGGAGTVNGILKANGSGVVSAAVAGTDYQSPLTAGSGISINAGTISATGLTTANLSSTAAITNAQLANSTTTLGNTTMTLGGTVTSVTGLTSLAATSLTGDLTGNVTGNVTGNLTGNASTATALATGRTISTLGDVTYTSGSFDGSTNVTGTATLTNTTVTAGSYGSSTAIPTFTVDSKGRLTAASTVGITAGVSTLNYTNTTSYAAGGTISGTSLTLTAADGTNPGLISTGAQTIAGAKTFSSNVIGNLTGNASTATTLATARNINGIAFDGSANITIAADANTLTGTTLASNVVNSSLTSVGTITSGIWSGTAISIAKGGTGLTSLTSGQIPFGNGTSALGTSSNLFWDNTNSRLGVGTNTPTTKLEVNGSFKAAGLSYPTSDGTAGQYLKTDGSGNIGFTSSLLAPSYTTTNRDAGTFSNGALIFNSTSGNIQASVPDNSSVVTSSISNSTGAANSWQPTYSSATQQNVYVQTFTTASAVNLTSISLNTYVNSSPATVIVKVFNDSDPSNGLTNEVASVSKDISSTSLSNMETYTFPSSYLTTANATYTFVVYGISSTNTFSVGTYGSNNYSGGSYFTSQANTSYNASSNLSSIILTNFTSNDLKFNINYSSGASASKWIDLLNTVDLTSNVSGALPLANGGTGATTAAAARTNLGLVIGTDVMAANYTTTLTGDVTGAGNGSFATSLANTNVTAGSYGSSTAIPTFTVDSKGRLTAASTVGITAGVSSLNYTTTTSYAAGGTISGTSLTLTAADGSNPGLVSTGTQTIAGAKTFNSNIIGNLTGNASTATTLATSRNINGIAFNGSADITIAADANTLTGTTLASNVVSSSLTSVGTITTGVWSGTAISIAKGGTGATTKAAAFDALSPMTTSGDIIYGGTSGTGTRLGVGTNGQVLTLASGVPSWASPTGITALAAIGSTPNANGGTISGTTFNLQPADATNGGLLTAGTQTIGGAKTFSNTTTFNSDITVNGLTVGKGAKNVASNTVIGISALKSTNAGSEIVAIGNNSLQAGNNSGSNLTAVGSYSGYYNSTGSDNSFFGYKAGFNNTTGLSNTAIGAESMGIGTTTGYGNSALGYRSLYRITEGYGNSAVGDSVLIANTSGYYNVGVGHQTLQSNLSGNNNIGLGYIALSANTTGYSNIGIGRSAINWNQTGNYNIGIGEQTLERLTGNTSNNIAIGFRAGKHFGTGTSLNLASSIAGNVLIGHDVRVNGASDVNQIVIAGYTGTGEGQIGLGSNTTSIGNASSQQSRIYGALTVTPNTATGAGNSSTIAAQNAGGTNTAGGALNLTAGNAGTTGLGGNIILTPGTSTTAANNGIVRINGQVQITGGSPGAGEVLMSDANGLATWSYSIGSTVVTSTTTYAITLAEAYVFYTGTADGAFTIPDPSSSNAGKEITIKNKTGFVITITASTGKIYIDSANTAANSVRIGIEASNNWIKLVSDGTQWNVLRALF